MDTIEHLADCIISMSAENGLSLCGFCNREDSISASKVTILKIGARRTAAEKLAEQGWSF
ncbi:MAG: hypothetical protein ACR2H1_03715 [Limisphaerales bacterium]